MNRETPALEFADGQRLLSDYIRAAADHTNATIAGDWEEANRQYKELIEAHAKLKAQEPAYRMLMLSLLQHQNPGVRLWAATHCLEHSPAEATLGLGSLASGSDIVALTAQTTLDEWKAGRLAL
jgi:hypothetical protein